MTSGRKFRRRGGENVEVEHRNRFRGEIVRCSRTLSLQDGKVPDRNRGERSKTLKLKFSRNCSTCFLLCQVKYKICRMSELWARSNGFCVGGRKERGRAHRGGAFSRLSVDERQVARRRTEGDDCYGTRRFKAEARRAWFLSKVQKKPARRATAEAT